MTGKEHDGFLPSGTMGYQQEMVLQTVEPQPDMTHGTVFFIGTATVLLRYGGFTILTDPNFLHQGKQVHLGYGLKSKRLTEPAIDIDQLPPLDAVLLSHLHEDHFDRIAMRKLDKTLPIVTTQHAAQALKKQRFIRTYGLSTWQTFTIYKGNVSVHVTALPARHAPGLLKALLPPVMGTMLDFQSSASQMRLRVYISGDTLLYDQLKEIPCHFPTIDLALLHLGGTRIVGMLVTMDGKQGVQALKLIAPHTAIPVHYDDYTVFKSPLDDFKRRVRDEHLEESVVYLKRGETYTFAATNVRDFSSC